MDNQISSLISLNVVTLEKAVVTVHTSKLDMTQQNNFTFRYFVSTLFLRLARCVYVKISYFIVFKVVQILFQITIEICSLNI